MKDKFSSILEPIAELLTKKRNDYGDNYEEGRDKRGPVAFYLRIEDKLNRIEQLDSNPAQVKEESIEDTLNDIIGYCTLEINYRRGVKTKPTPAVIPKLARCRGSSCYSSLINTENDVEKCTREATTFNRNFKIEHCKWRGEIVEC